METTEDAAGQTLELSVKPKFTVVAPLDLKTQKNLLRTEASILLDVRQKLIETRRNLVVTRSYFQFLVVCLIVLQG
eukprot:m.20998 g.20998  ORF g.20998 m.20998 type:complete len:76 (+) comp7007_c0_seq1:271-498(+)